MLTIKILSTFTTLCNLRNVWRTMYVTSTLSPEWEFKWLSSCGIKKAWFPERTSTFTYTCRCATLLKLACRTFSKLSVSKLGHWPQIKNVPCLKTDNRPKGTGSKAPRCRQTTIMYKWHEMEISYIKTDVLAVHPCTTSPTEQGSS